MQPEGNRRMQRSGVGRFFRRTPQIDLTKLKRGNGKQEGFSKIMYGSVVENIGKTCEVEEFDLW